MDDGLTIAWIDRYQSHCVVLRCLLPYTYTYMSTCVHTYRNDTPLVSRAKQEDRQTGMRRMYTLVLILETCFHLFILTSNIEIFMIICDYR